MLQQLYSSQLSGKMYEGVHGMEALKADWIQLWNDSNGISVQCYSYCLNAYIHIHHKKPKLRVVAVFDDCNKLVAVWPLMITYKGLWRVIRPVGPATAEFTEPLIKPGEHAAAIAAKLWQVVKKESGADLINLPFVREPTPLNAVLATEPNVVGKELDYFHHLYWPDGADTWDSYYGTLGSNHRKKLKQRMRALEKQGNVTYEHVTDPEAMMPYIQWILENKREWAKHIGLKNPGYWLTSDVYIHFLSAWARDTSRAETVRIDLLKLDGKVVAAFVVCVCNSWLEWIIGGYDGQFTKNSPGMYLQHAFVKWGYDNNKLEPDFGVGVEDNKRFWCGGKSGNTTTYHIANTAWGKIGYKALYGVYEKLKNRNNKARTDSTTAA
jgi:CelD/BcsL family acetyltransferase involved in cellulose biosynthesis